MTGAIYLIFFCSGFSGLVYQVVWVRVFGNVFGSTIYSASLVLAVFMLGLASGSYLVGTWADRRYAKSPGSLLSAYGYFELVIGVLGLVISAVLPHLGQLSALVSSYTTDDQGWYVLSAWSYAARVATCVALLAPITMLMGGTLTLLIRHLVRTDLLGGTRRIAVLYGVNTIGAALGALLTDYALVPFAGLRAAQWLAVFVNLVAAAVALALGARFRGAVSEPRREKPARQRSVVWLVGLALAASGFAAMGMEIVWFRHFTLLLGPLRAVYSTLLTVVLLGIGLGSLLGGALNRRTSRVAEYLIAAQGLLVVLVLWGMSMPSTRALSESAVRVGQRIDIDSATARHWAELWFNLTPILMETFAPAVLMGLMFPLANRLVQRDEESVGRRAGILYLLNTCGAVAGSLTAGFLLIPTIGLQRSAAVLTTIGWFSVVPIFVSARAIAPVAAVKIRERWPGRMAVLGVSALSSALALWIWWSQPPDFLLSRALLRPMAGERLVAMEEGVNEVVAVTEFDGDHRRWLLTNGYPMSSTGPIEQRYMRALAHIPLLCLDDPETVLVIGFGVGNTTHAAALHPSVRRVEVADLSREILESGHYFKPSNGDVLHNSRVNVFVNDGRQHLQMQPRGSYDLITLEPPPIAHAGVGALYSRDFYQLARTRLKPHGLISQWLPAYQVPAATTLAIVRAFLDVFPNTVLLSGGQPNLLLVGANASQIEIDPAHLAAALAKAPAVRADLEKVDLGSVQEIVGTFIASSQTLEAAAASVAVSDDRPLQEYSVRSLINFGAAGVPASIVDLTHVDQWCPRCFVGNGEAPAAKGLGEYMAVLGRGYMVRTTQSVDLSDRTIRQMIEKSAYLQLLLRNAAGVRNDRGLRMASEGRLEEAIEQFREALQLRPDFQVAEDNLTATLEAQRRQRP